MMARPTAADSLVAVGDDGWFRKPRLVAMPNSVGEGARHVFGGRAF